VFSVISGINPRVERSKIVAVIFYPAKTLFLLIPRRTNYPKRHNAVINKLTMIKETTEIFVFIGYSPA